MLANRNLPRLLRTVMHLRPSQLAWRVRYRVERPLESTPLLNVAQRIERRTQSLRFLDRTASTPCDAIAAASAEQRLVELSGEQLTLLNQQRRCHGGSDWCMAGGQEHDRLWKFTLHYHGWLVELACAASHGGDDRYATVIERYLSDWLHHCPLGAAGFTHYAWNSYTIATRLDNWRQLWRLMPSSFWNDRPSLASEFTQSIALQAAYLSDHIEWDVRANHLIRDALGLACAARWYSGHEADRWRRQATDLAISQATEQFLPDGGHFERSPMYHLEVTRDLRKLVSLLPAGTATDVLRRTISKAVEVCRWLRHPDGRALQWNDGSACNVDDLLLGVRDVQSEVADTPAAGGRHFPDTGVVAWHGRPWTVFFDAGDIGPDYQPGHAHADTLTVEASFDEQRLLVDPGCYGYDNDDRRRYDRGTASHNTVCIDHTDSSEMWHIFRVGRRARPRDMSVSFHDRSFTARAGHDGYDHLPGSPRHERRVSVHNNGTLEIEDRIEGRGTHHVSGGFLLDPHWTCTPTNNGWRIASADRALTVRVVSDREVACSIDDRVVHPDYGIELPAYRLTWSYDGVLPLRVRVLFQDGTDEDPGID